VIRTAAVRLADLEADARRAEERLGRLELALASPDLARPDTVATAPGPFGVKASAPFGARPSEALAPPAPSSRPAPRSVPAAAPKTPRPSLEELLGGRVLAWVGGAAVLVGLALLFALGISNGWIGEAERCVLAAVGCAGLLAAGVRLHERHGRTEAARAAVATALGGAFLTLTVAGSAYELLPSGVAVALAAAVGALAVALASRWASPTIAALGLVGALLSPVLAGLAGETAGLLYLAPATAAAIAVLVRQRWPWVSVCVALAVTPQWLGWLAIVHDVGLTLLVLVVFGALQAVAAIGTALRDPREDLRPLPATLLAVNALVLGVAGWFALLAADDRAPAIAWVAGLAAAHLALGLAARRTPRLATDLGTLCLTLGVVLADAAFALAADGVVLALGWAAGAVAFAAVTRLAARGPEVAGAATGPQPEGAMGGAGAPDRSRDAGAAASGLGLHVALAVLTTVPAVDTATLLGGGAPTASVTAMLAALAGACLVSARLAPAHRLGLDVLGLLAAAGLAALTLDGVALTAAWALEAVALCALGVRGDRVAWGAGLMHLAGAALWCLTDQAPPAGLYGGVAGLGAAALGMAVVLGATARVAMLVDEDDRPAVLGALALGALYLASLVVVDVGGADVRTGQLRLGGLWALVGVGALVAGLRADVAAVRAGALGLLGVTVVKVFVYDLATQEASYRVASFLGLGVLLLGAAFAYQRLRPEAPRDLRRVPPALR